MTNLHAEQVERGDSLFVHPAHRGVLSSSAMVVVDMTACNNQSLGITISDGRINPPDLSWYWFALDFCKYAPVSGYVGLSVGKFAVVRGLLILEVSLILEVLFYTS